MKLLKEYKLQFLIYLITTSVLLIVICTSLLTFVEFEKSKYANVELAKTEMNFVNFGKRVLQSEVSGYVSDLLFFRDMVESNYFNTNIKNRDDSREKLSEYFYFFAKRVQKYESISFLDLKGNEIVKVSYDGEKAYVSHPSELENYSDKHFYSEIQKLKKNEIYMQEIQDSNVSPKEGENIKTDDFQAQEQSSNEGNPYKKAEKSYIRICIPIVNNNIRRGIMMFVYDADNLLSLFERSLVKHNQEFYLVNFDSRFMSSAQKLEYMGERRDFNLKKSMGVMFPEEWNRIKDEDKGQFSTENGYFSFVRLNVKDIYTHRKPSEYQIIFGDRMWYLISHIERNNYLKLVLSENKLLALSTIVSNNISLYLLLIVISLFISFVLVFNRYNKERIQYFSEYDDMTKALNRRAGREKLEKVISESDIVSVCFTDVNGLKIVNDTLGHELGDELLTTFSNIVLKSTRKFDYFVRLGGDEFLIILPDMTQEKSLIVWDRIQKEIDFINENENRPYEVSVSYGIVDTQSVKEIMDPNQFKNPVMVAECMVNLADERMYEYKNRTRSNMKILR